MEMTPGDYEARVKVVAERGHEILKGKREKGELESILENIFSGVKASYHRVKKYTVK